MDGAVAASRKAAIIIIYSKDLGLQDADPMSLSGSLNQLAEPETLPGDFKCAKCRSGRCPTSSSFRSSASSECWEQQLHQLQQQLQQHGRASSHTRSHSRTNTHTNSRAAHGQSFPPRGLGRRCVGTADWTMMMAPPPACLCFRVCVSAVGGYRVGIGWVGGGV